MSDEINNSIKNPNSDILSVANDIGQLYLQSELSDLILIVHQQKLHVHRIILASRCQYFRALLYGGLKESYEAEIELQEDTSVTAVEQILKFIYRGSVTNLNEMSDVLIMELLALAHKYGLSTLEKQIAQHLAEELTIDNVVMVLNVAVLYQIKHLTDVCLRFLDRNSQFILENNNNVQGMSKTSLIRMLSRDSFCGEELSIFQTAVYWLSQNTNLSSESMEDVIQSVRLSLIPLHGLLTTVRESGLVSADQILDSIHQQQNQVNFPLHHRGILLPEENLATTARGMVFIRGKAPTSSEDIYPQKNALSHPSLSTQDSNANNIISNTRIIALHDITSSIDESSGSCTNNCIELDLNAPCHVNQIQFQPTECTDSVSFSYILEVGLYSGIWTRIVDYSSYLCRGRQILVVPTQYQVLRYIRLRGTRTTSGNKSFCIRDIRVVYTEHCPSFHCFNEYGSLMGLVDVNVAHVSQHACVIEGVSRVRNSLLDGYMRNYDWDSGYTCHQLGNGAIVVQLAQPHVINTIKFLLWDLDERHYGYTVEVSLDRCKWALICDRTDDVCSSIQYVEFLARPVIFIRVTGRHNTANEVFHIVHLEASYASKSPQMTGSGTSSTSTSTHFLNSESCDTNIALVATSFAPDSN